MNPFLYHNFCCGSHFCFRDNELQKLDQLINNNSNILLYSKRKFGKTSLINEFFNNKINKEEYLTFYIDLFDITNFADFTKNIYKQIAYNLPYDYRIIVKKLKEFFHLVHYTAFIKDNGELEFEPVLNCYNLDELLADIYRGLDQLSIQCNKKIVIAFDEFHHITLLKETKIEQALKKYIKEYPQISYIFTGLKRHLLSDIFFKKKSILHEEIEKFELEPIPKKEFYAFIDQKFENKLSYEYFEHIYDMTEGESRLIQEFCYHLYNRVMHENNGARNVNQDDIDMVCMLLLESKSDYFKLILNQLSLPQKIALKAVIISDGKELYTKENLFKLQTTKSSLNTAIRHLYKDEIIDKDNNAYYVSNKCFELWCKKKFL